MINAISLFYFYEINNLVNFFFKIRTFNLVTAFLGLGGFLII